MTGKEGGPPEYPSGMADADTLTDRMDAADAAAAVVGKSDGATVELKPFHETVVELLQKINDRDTLRVIQELVEATEVPSQHAEAVVADALSEAERRIRARGVGYSSALD